MATGKPAVSDCLYVNVIYNLLNLISFLKCYCPNYDTYGIYIWACHIDAHTRARTHTCAFMCVYIGLLPDTQNCGLRKHRECRERFPHHRLQRKPLFSDPGMHHGTCVTHVPWCMSGSLTDGGGENAPDIPSACTTHNLTYLARGPLHRGEILVNSLRLSDTFMRRWY